MGILEFFASHRTAILLACAAVAVVIITVGGIVLLVNRQRPALGSAVENRRRKARDTGVSVTWIGLALLFMVGFLGLGMPAVRWLVFER